MHTLSKTHTRNEKYNAKLKNALSTAKQIDFRSNERKNEKETKAREREKEKKRVT